MASDLEKTLDSLPAWVIPAVLLMVVVLAMMSKQNRGGSSYNTVVYGPAPVDPGLISLAQSEVTAKQDVFTTALNAFISRDIQAGANDRDVHLATIGANVENNRTQAAQAVAMQNSSDNARIQIYQAQEAGKIVDSQGATAKYIARKQAQSSIWGDLFSFGSSVVRAFVPVH